MKILIHGRHGDLQLLRILQLFINRHFFGGKCLLISVEPLIPNHPIERLTIIEQEVMIARIAVHVCSQSSLLIEQRIDGRCGLHKRLQGMSRCETTLILFIES